MVAQVFTITRNYVTTRFGGRLLDVDYDFSFDPDNCDFKFLGGTPSSTGYTFGGTGPTWTTTVRQFANATAPCETPPDTCKKTISVHLRIRETISLTIPLIGTFIVRPSRVIVNRQLRFATQCRQNCC